jgi:multidrug transporter EmrE-like cation transporter
MNVGLFLIYWGMQVVSAVTIKYSSTSDRYRVAGFIVGNAFSAASIWFLMILYTRMHPNVALGIGAGGAFMWAQIALSAVFRNRLTVMQVAGLAGIIVGMLMLALGA